MKLNAADVVLFQHCREWDRILTDRRRGRDHRRIIAVRKVDVGLVAGVAQQLRLLHALELIPAHVRDAHLPPETLDLTWINTQAALLRSFLARREQRL